MQVQTIEIPKDKARAAYLSYREQVKTQRTKDLELMRKAYLAASQGKKLVDIFEVFSKLGTDNQKRPMLAICRGGFKWVHYRAYDDGAVFKGNDGLRWYSNNQTSWNSVRLRGIGYPRNYSHDHRAMVPIVPAHLRPASAIANYHILFEPRWESVPADPILLKHLGGTLYAVLASWDETPIENAVLRGL